jgi:hypothetical protein
MATPTWRKLVAAPTIQRSSQTLAVIAENAYIHGGELRPREPVDSVVHTVQLKPGKPAVTVRDISSRWPGAVGM